MNYILEYLKAIENGEIITSKRVYKVYKKLADNMKNPDSRYILRALPGTNAHGSH